MALAGTSLRPMERALDREPALSVSMGCRLGGARRLLGVELGSASSHELTRVVEAEELEASDLGCDIVVAWTTSRRAVVVVGSQDVAVACV